jgi:glutamate/tyrosine decarboxylase-like PLP-dependent enzyme
VVSETVKTLRSPDEIKARFAALGCDVSLMGASGTEEQLPHDVDVLLAAVDETLESSVRTGHPLFQNQLFAGADPISIGGELLISATNTNVHTYEVAPVFTLVEQAVTEKVAALAGWRAGADGLFTPGGSISNMYGMQLARAAADPDFLTRGASGGKRLVGFVSDDSHYSYAKAARLLGIGSDNLVRVATEDATGKMDLAALDEAVRAVERDANALPFFVGSTAGTTVRGAFDDLGEISALCARSPSPLWHHVDASWGGGRCGPKRTVATWRASTPPTPSRRTRTSCSARRLPPRSS